MSFPSYVQFVGPLLEFLAEQTGPVRARVAYDELANRMKISAEDRSALLPSGNQPIFHNRIGWAQDALKRSGLSAAPTRGVWVITDEGRRLLSIHSGRLPEPEMERIGSTARDVAIRDLKSSNGVAKPIIDVSKPALAQSPREQIGAALALLRQSVARDILDQIARQTPDDFENLVLDLLFKLGYGTNREALRRVGRSGDGGIDGIVSLDRLGLQKVYVQAKKWQGQVGAPQIQTFMGALQLQGADKGVLITSGTISGPAREAARQARGSVVLIDGERLAGLMIDHGVGVAAEPLRIPKIDTDYFEGE